MGHQRRPEHLPRGGALALISVTRAAPQVSMMVRPHLAV